MDLSLVDWQRVCSKWWKVAAHFEENLWLFLRELMMQSPSLALNVRAPVNGECMLSILSGGLSLSNGGCFMECAFFFRIWWFSLHPRLRIPNLPFVRLVSFLKNMRKRLPLAACDPPRECVEIYSFFWCVQSLESGLILPYVAAWSPFLYCLLENLPNCGCCIL